MKYKISEFEDVEYQVVENDKIVTKILTENEQAKLLNQINAEYDLAYSDTESKRAAWLERLKLYNNQKRAPDTVGDPLIFTIFNTIHASLWEDFLACYWEGRGGQGDEDVEANLNALANFDYDIMQKAELDYDWNWDAEFFGRALVQMMDFDRTKGKQCPVPEVIDPTTWIRDPKAKSVNGDMSGRGAMRFGGVEIGLSYWEMKDNPAYFNLGFLKKGKEINSLLNKAADARATAQGRVAFNPKEEVLTKSGNYEFAVIRWFTNWKGKKIMVELGNQRTLVVRIYKLDNLWPIIDRALYPMAHDWDGVTIPDFTEDKQRAKAVLLNLGLKSSKADVLANYLYDASRITNKKDLNFKFNKFIPVQGRVDNAMMPIQKSIMHQTVNIIMDILDQSAQKALATPEMQSGIMSSEKRTLGEINLVSSKVDTRYSMSAKLYGLSDARFWRQWYALYKKHFKEGIDEKIIRIQGIFAPTWRPLTRENIIAQVDPDVKIESKIISEAKRRQRLQDYMPYAGMVLQDPTNNRRFIQKKLAKLMGHTKEEIDMTFPPTVDELQAEEENILINDNKPPKPDIRDDHQAHLSIHAKASVNAALMAHIKAHRDLMVQKRNMPAIFPPAGEPQFAQPNQPGGQQPPKQPQPAAPTQ